MKKIGIISSSGGGVIFEALDFIRKVGSSIVVVTDREVPIEERCEDANIPLERIEYETIEEFSKKARNFFLSSGVKDSVFLYFTRFIGQEVYNTFDTYNFHPSYLPLFPGLSPLKKHLQTNAPMLGATVHKVDETCDSGTIIGQTICTYKKKEIERISFLQKVFLTISLIDSIFPDGGGNKVSFLNSNLTLSTYAFECFNKIQMKYKRNIISEL